MHATANHIYTYIRIQYYSVYKHMLYFNRQHTHKLDSFFFTVFLLILHRYEIYYKQ